MAEDTASNLVGKRISTTFRGLLHLPHSIDVVNPNIKQIVYDGQGSPTSLNIAGSGYGAEVFGDLSVSNNVNITNNLNLSGNISATGNLSISGNIDTDKINDVYFPKNSTTISLSAPNAINIGNINLIDTASDYEINFGKNKLFSIYVKKNNPNNLYIKPNNIVNEDDSPLWINTLTNEVNIANLRISSIATNPTLDTPVGTDLYRHVIPVGSIVMFPSLTIPDGWFKCNGDQKDKNFYGDLFKVINYTYGKVGDDFLLPDLRGVFVRGLDEGKNIDSGRTLGSFIQDDVIKLHKHGTAGVNKTGTELIHTTTTSYGPYAVYDVVDGDNVNGGNETRPKNIALVYCIKW